MASQGLDRAPSMGTDWPTKRVSPWSPDACQTQEWCGKRDRGCHENGIYAIAVSGQLEDLRAHAKVLARSYQGWCFMSDCKSAMPIARKAGEIFQGCLLPMIGRADVLRHNGLGDPEWSTEQHRPLPTGENIRRRQAGDDNFILTVSLASGSIPTTLCCTPSARQSRLPWTRATKW
ncbi:hypothetical protein BJX68DRAFT_237801 [Aspergillus pseudodeflectus]|uniref:Uncharacterized protein n=1 Tax=Aspergillus pseudodeflectus TaxID=176178 RepID=A0ABR4KBY5_9EURO